MNQGKWPPDERARRQARIIADLRRALGLAGRGDAARDVADARVMLVYAYLVNDQPYAAVRSGFDLLMSRLAGRDVVVVGPAPAPRRLTGARRVDGWLAALSRSHGVDYVSSIHEALPYLPDRLHLTPAGHRTYGDFVARHLPA